MSDNKQRTKIVERHNIAYDPTAPTMYGGPAIGCCPPLFDLNCSDGSVGIFHTGGEFELALRWFGFKRATARREEINYLQYMGSIKRAAGDTSLPGVPATICEPGDRAGFGKPCTDVKDCFGMIKICGDPIVDGGNDLPYCQRDPRVTIDGETIVDDEMWHEANVSEAMLNSMAYNLLWGYKDAAANKMSHYGLWSLLGGYGDARDYTYSCPELKAKVLDWAGNEACSPTAMTGITLNGQALTDDYRVNIYKTLRDIFFELRRQMRRTRGLSATNFQYGDWAILGPEEIFHCLIECAVCFTECNNQCNQMDSERAAVRMQELREAGEGFGALDFFGFKVPLIPFDPSILEQDSTGAVTASGSLKNADGSYNLMFLFRGVGNRRVLQPEFNPLDDGEAETRDSGSIQMYMDRQDICKTLCMRHEWRWDKRGVMFSVLIKNLKCATLFTSTLLTGPVAATSTC
jgi:hypothetical protein